MAPYYMGPDGGQIKPDRYYDDNAPETTLLDDVLAAVDLLLTVCPVVDAPKNGTLEFYIWNLRAARDNMCADELPDYDAPTTDDMTDDERKALEEATGQ